MTITVNGATNTITAPSGLTVAGNTAVSGTLSATGALTSGTATASNATVGGAIGTSFQQQLVNTHITVGDWIGTAYRWIAGDSTTTQAYIGAVLTSSASNGLSDLVFGVKDSAGASAVSEYMRIVGGGAVSFPNGQIKFPASQNASADANTLDDYEEGTWTPTDASGAGLSITGTDCKYTKVGRLVTLSGNLGYPVTASGANAKVAVPFTPGQQRAAGAAVGVSANVSSYTAPNDAGLYFLTNTGGGVQTNATLSGSNILVTITYSI